MLTVFILGWGWVGSLFLNYWAPLLLALLGHFYFWRYNHILDFKNWWTLRWVLALINWSQSIGGWLLFLKRKWRFNSWTISSRLACGASTVEITFVSDFLSCTFLRLKQGLKKLVIRLAASSTARRTLIVSTVSKDAVSCLSKILLCLNHALSWRCCWLASLCVLGWFTCECSCFVNLWTGGKHFASLRLIIFAALTYWSLLSLTAFVRVRWLTMKEVRSIWGPTWCLDFELI